MRSLLFASTVGVLLLLPACSWNRIKAEGTSYASTAGYQTWAWSAQRSLTLRDSSRDSGEVRVWLEQAIDSELGIKGLIKGAPDSSDLLVAYSVGSRAGTVLTDHEEGRLAIDVMDRKTGQVVYRGTTKAALLEKASEKRSVLRVQKAVARMLDDFRKS